jgi:hypothetical protein
MEAGAALHLGQAVRFVDFRTGELRQGTLLDLRRLDNRVHIEAFSATWPKRVPVRRRLAEKAEAVGDLEAAQFWQAICGSLATRV